MQEQESSSLVPPSLPKCPYVGLDAFSEEDAPFFFGREEDTETIVSNLQAWRLTLLYGESGVGKSSVLRAGVVAYLQRQAKQNLIEQGRPKLAVVVYNRWREDSLQGLLESINEAVRKAWGGQRDFPAFPFTGDLPELLQAWTERVEGELFIIFDQFEEYCLYNPVSNDLASFEQQLAQAINTPYLQVNFLLSIRADALEKLDRFKTLLPGLFDNYIRLNYLTRKTGALAIQQPLYEYNTYLTATEVPYTIEEQLVEAVLDGVKTGKVAEANQNSGLAQADTGQNAGIEAPYLQLVLTEIWQTEIGEASRTLRLNTLLKLNGAESIVLNYLNSIMNGFSPVQSKIAVHIFRHFVTRSGAKHAQSLVSLNELTELPTESLLPVLEKLEHSRILRSNRVSNPPHATVESYEIFHDVLAPAILDWRRRYAAKMEIERQAEELNRQKEEEKRQQREKFRRRWFFFGFGLLSALLLIVLIFALRVSNESNIANSARDTANAGSITIKAQNLTEVALRSKEEELRIIAQRDGAKADEQGKLARGLLLALQARRKLTSDMQAELETGLLLAIEATRRINVFETRSTLLQGIFRAAEVITNTPSDQSLLYLRSLSGHTSRVSSLAFSPDKKLVASGSVSTLILYETQTGNIKFQHKFDRGNVSSLAFSTDGKILAAGNGFGEIYLIDPTSGKIINTLKGHSGVLRYVRFLNNNKTLLSASNIIGEDIADNSIRLWNIENPEQPIISTILIGSPNLKLAFAVNNNETLLAYATTTDIILFDLVKRTELKQFRGENSTIYSLAFSPDDKSLASSGGDSNPNVDIANFSIRLWDVEAGVLLNRLVGHTKTAREIAFTSDNAGLVSVGYDETIRFWDVKTPELLATTPLIYHLGRITSLSLSGSGELIVSGDETGGIGLWNFETASLQEQACKLAKRNFSQSEWLLYMSFVDTFPQTTCPAYPFNSNLIPSPTPVTAKPVTTSNNIPTPPTRVINTYTPRPTIPPTITPPAVSVTSSDSVVNLGIPFIHQTEMSPPEFDGNWADGPACVLMVAAYYDKLPALDFRVKGLAAPYGWYISNIFTAPTTGYVFSREDKDPVGKNFAGAYGHVVENGDGYGWRMADFLQKLQLNSKVLTNGESYNDEIIKSYLKQGKPIILSTMIQGFGHIVVIKGYLPDGRFIAADPFWSKVGVGETIYTRGELGNTPYMVVVDDLPSVKKS